MTAAKPAQTQPRSTEKTVPLERFHEVSRTRRFEPASRARSTEKGQDRRDEQLITANQKTHEQNHQGARIEARSARRNHSSFSAAYEARAAGRTGDDHEPKTLPQPPLLRPNDVPQPPAHAIPDHGPANPLRGDQTHLNECWSVSGASTPRISDRPRCAVPSVLTRANCEGPDEAPGLRERAIGRNGVDSMTHRPYTDARTAGSAPVRYSKSLPAEMPREDFRLKPVRLTDSGSNSCRGGRLGLLLGRRLAPRSCSSSLFFSVLAAGFTMVVLCSVFLLSWRRRGATSVLCSHAPRSAALARMQINFFIIWIGCPSWD